MNTKIYAASVTNLTDARYFSAMGVDYIGFDIDYFANDLSSLKEILAWVEGPELLGELSINDLSFNEQLFELGLHRCVIDQMLLENINDERIVPKHYYFGGEYAMSNSSLVYLSIEESFVAMHDEMKNNVRNLCKEKKVILDIDINIVDIESIVLYFQPHAIVLHGGAEEKVGYKSYDDLDELIEKVKD